MDHKKVKGLTCNIVVPRLKEDQNKSQKLGTPIGTHNKKRRKDLPCVALGLENTCILLKKDVFSISPFNPLKGIVDFC